MRLVISFILLLLLSCNRQLQYSSTLRNLQENYQNCIDRGKGMMLCSRNYSIQMDSMLNVVYKDLLNKLDIKGQELLRIEEREWIETRDKELEKIWANVNTISKKGDFIPQDERIFAYDKEAEFIKLRVKELIQRLEDQK